MEKTGNRFIGHLSAWSFAVFVGLMVFFSRESGVPIMVQPFIWYTPFVWILYAVAAILACGTIAAVPALTTALIAENITTWSKLQKALLFSSAFVAMVLCVAFFVKFPS